MLVDPTVPKLRPRWLALAAPVVAALMLHWLLLGSAAAGSGVRSAQEHATPVQVRTVLSPPSSTAVAAAEPVAAVAPMPARPPARPKRHAVQPTSPPVAEPALQEPLPVPLEQQEQEAPALFPSWVASAETSIETVAVAAGAAGAQTEVPRYRTVMPPATTLHYGLQRGLWSGTGELVWQPSGDHYEARLEGYVAGLRVLTQISQGGFDHAGIAPLRFTDQRLRQVKAANFQRDKGKLTYSGSSAEVPLIPGAQDRLSWMIQLAAVVNAEPKYAEAGGKVAMFVTGVRADADVWVFHFVATETVHTGGGGTIRTLKFSREPRRPYDTQVEVWLDPARHYLPVRAKLTTAPNGEAFELVLRGTP